MRRRIIDSSYAALTQELRAASRFYQIEKDVITGHLRFMK